MKKWNDKTCTDAARECSSATEFRNKFPGAYSYAHKKKERFMENIHMVQT